MAAANLAVRFLLELAGIAALAYWGWTATAAMPLRLVLAMGAPLLLVVAWAFVVAPNATNPIPRPTRELIGTGLLLGSAAAVFVAGQRTPAIAFAGIVVFNQVLLVIMSERP